MTTEVRSPDVLVHEEDCMLTVTLNRPERRNAMTDAAMDILEGVVADVHGRRGEVRVVVIRGAGGTFCAGGDLKTFQSAFQEGSADRDATATMNRRFGTLLSGLDRLPAVVVAAIEGAAMGGGVGLAAIADVTLATADARFCMTETTIGIPPAQISPFVTARLGAHQARRLMLTAADIDGSEAARIGLVDTVVPDPAALNRAITDVVTQVRRCAPRANAVSKDLVHAAAIRPLEEVLDQSAYAFADALLGDEAKAGVRAFVQRGPAPWAVRS